MIRTMMLASAFALSAPAIAQEATPPAQPATESTTTTPPAQAQLPAPTAAPQAATPAAAAPSASTTTTAQNTANDAGNVAKVVDSDWASFDSDKNGELSKTEFTAWMTKLRAAQPNAPTADAKAWTEAAFAQADADKSKSVSKGELTTFLQG